MTTRPATATTTRISHRSDRATRGVRPASRRPSSWAGPWSGRVLLGVLALAAHGAPAHAHPEDDICGPDSGLDPDLCRALSELESAPPGRAAEMLAAQAGDMSAPEALVAFFQAGWDHVLPAGFDHVLFIAALFLSTPRLGALAAQLSAFTLAHTVTVGLSAAGLIAPPNALVEPLIAATIALVAVEAVAFSEPPRWRLALVFLFGLIHGMGFARAFSAASASGEVFWPGLLGFNLGVEAAQIVAGAGVLLIAWALRTMAMPGATRDQARRRITVPACIAIGLAGTIWFVQSLTS